MSGLIVCLRIFSASSTTALTQAGAFERIRLLTFFRDEFDFRVDVCLKMTANRLYKQPEFEKPEMVTTICPVQRLTISRRI